MYRTPISNLYSPSQYKKGGDKTKAKSSTSSAKTSPKHGQASTSKTPPAYSELPRSSTDSLPAYADATSGRSSPSYPDEKKQRQSNGTDVQAQKQSKRAAIKSLFTSNPQRHNAMHVLEESATGQPSTARQSKSSGKQSAPKPGYWQELPKGQSTSTSEGGRLRRGDASELTPPTV